MQHVEQKIITYPEYLTSPVVFIEIHVVLQGFPRRSFSASLTHKKMLGLITLSQLRPGGRTYLTSLVYT